MRQRKALSAIKFHHLVPVRLPAGKLKAVVGRILKDGGRIPEEVNYIFCSDEYLLKVNQTYLGHDFYTDIITFDLDPASKAVMADVYISADRVRDNASRLGVRVSEELARVVLHGALHLAGFRDKSKAEKGQMTRAEDRYLEILRRQSVPRETKAKKKFHVKHRKGVS